MTGDFKEFKVESHANTTWDPQNAMASTAVCRPTLLPSFFLLKFVSCLLESGIELIPGYVLQDYLASIDNSANENSGFK